MILVLALILVAVFVISVFHPLYLISKQYFVIHTNECVIHTNLNYLLFSKISISEGKLRYFTAYSELTVLKCQKYIVLHVRLCKLT